MNKIRLVSLNVSIFDDNNLKLSQFFKEINPDIVCLQEVSRKVDNSAFEKYITKDIFDSSMPLLKSSFYAPNFALSEYQKENFHGKKLFYHNFGGVIESGNYIKSKFPIYEGQSLSINGEFTYITDWKDPATQSNLSRMMQVAYIKIKSNLMISCINYHGIWTKNKEDTISTIQATKKILNIMEKIKVPTILCGDFNLLPNTESIQLINEEYSNLIDRYRIKTTRPKSNELSNLDRNIVDYIFVSKDITVHNLQVIDTNVSDHLPLAMDFSIEK